MAKSSKKTGLGRGFDSLIPTEVINAEFDPTAAADKSTSRVLIQDVIPNKEQPRSVFEDQPLLELVESIKVHGVLQPIVVVRDGDKFRLIAGERRWRAAQLAGLEDIPALVRTFTEQEQLEVALIENLQREDLNPLEMATAFLKLQQQFNLAHEQIANRVGKAMSTVSNTIRLLQLPEPAKRALLKGQISEGHARQILALTDNQKQQELLDYILKFGWSVRKAEQFVTAYKEGAVSGEIAAKRTSVSTPETDQLGKLLKTKVEVRNMAKGGRLVITYKDDKDFKRITKKLIG